MHEPFGFPLANIPASDTMVPDIRMAGTRLAAGVTTHLAAAVSRPGPRNRRAALNHPDPEARPWPRYYPEWNPYRRQTSNCPDREGHPCARYRRPRSNCPDPEGRPRPRYYPEWSLYRRRRSNPIRRCHPGPSCRGQHCRMQKQRRQRTSERSQTLEMNDAFGPRRVLLNEKNQRRHRSSGTLK